MSGAHRRALVALVLTACAIPSVDEYAGGSRDAGSSLPIDDAGVEASALAEASIDASADAGNEASVEAGLVTGCPSGALLCEAFEGDLGAWRKQETLASIGVGDGTSGKGLVIGIDVHDTTRREAFLERRVTLAARTPFTVTKDIKFSTVTNVGLVDIDFFRFYPPFYRGGIRIANYGGGFFVKDYGDGIGGGSSTGSEVPIPPIPANTWVRMGMSISYPSATSMRVKVTVDGKQVYEGPSNGSPYAGSAPYIHAGVSATEATSTSALIVSTDNVVVTSP